MVVYYIGDPADCEIRNRPETDFLQVYGKNTLDWTR